MSQHPTAMTNAVGSSDYRRRRWVIGAVGASGLILGALGVPVSADDVTAVSKPHASAAVEDGCVAGAVGTGESAGSVAPQGGEGQLQATGEGTATVSVCLDDPVGSSPEDPGGSEPGDLDDVLPGDLDGSEGDDLVREVTDALEGLPGGGDGSGPGEPGDGLEGLDDLVPGELGDVIPGGPGGGGPGGGGPGGGGPGSGGPGGLDDVVPGGLGGLLPGGSGGDTTDLLDRLTQIVLGAVDDVAAPGGNGGGQPAVSPSMNGSGSVSVASAGDEQAVPADGILGAELGAGMPASVSTDVSPGGTLPRTGGGLGSGVLRLVALLGLGRAAAALANRKRRAVGAGLG